MRHPTIPWQWRWRRTLLRHPRALALAVGVATALLLLLLAGLLALRQQIEWLAAGHAVVHQRMNVLQTEVGQVLQRLQQHDPLRCDADDLVRLRSVVLGSRFVRDVVVLDEQGRQFCNTSVGRVDPPLAWTGQPIDGAVGRYWLNTPLQRLNPAAAAEATGNMVQRGRFIVLASSQAFVQESFREHADAVWAGAGGQRRRVFGSPAVGLTQDPVPADAPRLQCLAAPLRCLVTHTNPGPSPVSLQSVIEPAAVWRSRWPMGLAVLCTALLLGVLMRSVTLAALRRMDSPDRRVRALVQAGQVECHYQPIVDLATGRVVGCEVLTRLRDGDALIWPDRFIPSLTRERLQWSFDALASARALDQLARHLPPQPQGFTVALNFFPQSLRGEPILAHLAQCLARANRPDLHIDLEVTEYDFVPEMVPTLAALKAAGHGISLDDFGTGYSNLGVLKRLAPDRIKIDRSFVAEMEDATLRASLIPEILAIARAVGSEVLAEGIETEAQLQRLRELKVGQGQGYLFSRPLPLQALLQHLEQAARSR